MKKEKSTIFWLVVTVLAFGLDFLLSALITYIGCNLIIWLGFTLPFVWSWRVAVVLWLLIICIRILLPRKTEN